MQILDVFLDGPGLGRPSTDRGPANEDQHTLCIAISAPVIIFVLGLAGARAQQLENPPVGSARALLGAQTQGANYQIEDRVPSDGFLRIFTLNTKYGHYRVAGFELLKVRLRELSALEALAQMNKSKAFTDAAARAATAPVRLAEGLVTNPIGTVEQTMSGVGALFSRATAAVGNVGKDRDNIADSALGVSPAKRQIAFRLGVDPYTEFKPLADALNDMARVTALGGLTVSAALMAIPGGAGIAVSYSKTAQDVGETVRDKTPSELRDVNRTALSEMKVPDTATKAFLDNEFYTPMDQTAIVTALTQMGGVENKQVYVARASQASDRETAFFIRRRAELLADYHRRVDPIAEFMSAGWLPFNRTRSGKLLFLLPLDGLAWTKYVNEFASAIEQDIKRRNLGNKVELRIAGTATSLVRQNLKQRGWMLVENATN